MEKTRCRKYWNRLSDAITLRDVILGVVSIMTGSIPATIAYYYSQLPAWLLVFILIGAISMVFMGLNDFDKWIDKRKKIKYSLQVKYDENDKRFYLTSGNKTKTFIPKNKYSGTCMFALYNNGEKDLHNVHVLLNSIIPVYDDVPVPNEISFPLPLPFVHIDPDIKSITLKKDQEVLVKVMIIVTTVPSQKCLMHKPLSDVLHEIYLHAYKEYILHVNIFADELENPISKKFKIVRNSIGNHIEYRNDYRELSMSLD